jgi:hypothetical protein
MSYVDAQRNGLEIDAPRAMIRAFPTWFELYPFAEMESAVPAPHPRRVLRDARLSAQ